MPDWLLSIPRALWAPARWTSRRIRRHALDRQALVREGADVVTPVIQLAKSLGPESILLRTDEENRSYLEERERTWIGLRDRLMTYANQHPSDQVRRLADDVAQVVWTDLRNTAWLLSTRKSATTMDAFLASQRAHHEALNKTERLMVAIRRY